MNGYSLQGKTGTKRTKRNTTLTCLDVVVCGSTTTREVWLCGRRFTDMNVGQWLALS